MTTADRHPLFVPLVFLGGLIFGAGLAVSNMVRPEVVLSFLRLEDLGLLFVMGGAAAVTAAAVLLASRLLGTAPLTNATYGQRIRSLDRNVVGGGLVFGVGWGLSGICPGAAYASLGVGNWPIMVAIGGMFVGAYLQGWVRAVPASDSAVTASRD